MKTTDIAYAAGAIDADGCISIKRATNRVRITRDCRNAVYSPRVSLGQVTEAVPEFLRANFGGAIYKTKPGTRNSRALFKWYTSDKKAAAFCKTIRPYLKIKHAQADAVLALAELKTTRRARTPAYWFAIANPDWRDGELLTTAETATLLGYGDPMLVSQAISNGTLLTASSGSTGRTATPRIPKRLVEILVTLRGKGQKFVAAPEFISAQHAIYETIRSLNTIGVNGTCVNHNTGCHAPLG
jgi:hypothetical protein